MRSIYEFDDFELLESYMVFDVSDETCSEDQKLIFFCCAIQEKIYVVGGFEEEVGPLNVKVEIYSPISDSGTSVPDLVLDKNSNIVLVGSSDGQNLSIWSHLHGVAVKHLLDQTRIWIKKPSGVFPSKFKVYTHTIFVGKLIIRVMGILILWYDDEYSMEWIRVDGYARLKSVPFNVVDYDGNLRLENHSLPWVSNS